MNERHCIITNYACGAKYAKQRMCGMRSMRSIGGKGGRGAAMLNIFHFRL